MDRLQAMQVFTKVVEMNSFSRAADALNLPRASATTIIKKLEAHLQVHLIQRTTRRLNLTPEGAEYYERCVCILAEIDETEGSFAKTGMGPRGKLRLDMPASIGRLIVIPRIGDFRKRYPHVELMLGFGDRPVDLIQEAVDCAIRVGELRDSGLVARRLGNLLTLTAASPGYIRRYGAPQVIEDLHEHMAVQYFSNSTGRNTPFNFMAAGHSSDVKMKGTLSVNDADAYVMCGVDGEGIIQSPRFMLAPYLSSGELVEVLPTCKPRSMPIAAVYPRNRYLAPKVRAFVEWITVLFQECPLMSEVVDVNERGSTSHLVKSAYPATHRTPGDFGSTPLEATPENYDCA
ncbi:LysR family transcriptional regulator [Paraburkholderia aspalathi]|uniref:Transcriptional regulator, LysR family n=1 Tax=Paraburkholderia aspalathi TaxID=1324617 RepID=A0A1I7EPP8_9BURK|nr:LysR family transcriptional regulator [Paraburkholderia aspalathi]SFU25906.1 transcriptional regulator, LysR family [Paraburkholderia aspalathi]